jgi:hypothetical protein
MTAQLGDESGKSHQFESSDPALWSFLLSDARASATRALDPSVVTESDADGLALMSKSSTKWYEDMARSAAEVEVVVTPGIVTLALISCIDGWEVGGEAIAYLWSELPEFSGVHDVLVSAHRLVHTLALADDEANDRNAIADAATDLASALRQASRYDVAIAAAISAANIGTDPSRRIAASEHAREAAIAIDRRDYAGHALALRAKALTDLAREDPTMRPMAFDAILTALRHASEGSTVPASASEIWRAIKSSEDMKSLQPLWLLAFSELKHDDPDVLASMLRARRLLAPTWDLKSHELVSLASDIRNFYVDVENQRLRLEPVERGEYVEASWRTWSFDDPSYRHAIPHGSSITREKDLDRILLVMNHELTHVFSMMSGIGLAMTALRAALLNTEVTLWTFSASATYVDLPRIGVAPLAKGDVTALSEAEQALETSRKIQILQAVWNPWFEGVAAFGELAGDPTSEDIASNIGDVLANLVDVPPPEDANDLEHLLLERRTEWENRYAAAQRGEGADRLQAYLDRFHGKFLAGYVAVRMVVAAWRSKLEVPLNGSAATRLLLHLIRFGSFDAVPPLSLPSTEFAASARQSMTDWVARMADITADELRTLAVAKDSYTWKHGLLVKTSGSVKESEELVGTRFRQFVLEAAAALVGENADPSRVTTASEFCRAIMSSAANALTLAEPPEEIATQLLNAMQAVMGMVPLGQVTAPFWLNRPTGSFICMIRTTEHNVADDGPSYDVLSTPLTETEFQELEAAEARSMLPRMTVTRLADVVQANEAWGQRGHGRNVVAFQYGDWLKVQLRGPMFGASSSNEMSNAVRARLSPPMLVQTETKFIASGVAGALRTIGWIDGADRWYVGTEPVPVEAWAAHVKRLAQEVAKEDDTTVEVEAGRELLRRLGLSPELIDDLVTRGIRALADERNTVQSIASFAHNTGFSPVATGQAAEASVPPLFEHGRHGWDIIAARR